MANNTPYGLTAGLHSLSEKEHDFWLSHIKAGNLYINRTITGAIVRRQPFGGCKASGYGPGHKAGGPNYLSQLATPIPTTLPKEKHPIPRAIEHLSKFLENVSLSADELGIWYASLAHYAFWASKFGQKHDASLILGQDNFLSYVPLEGLCFRIQAQDRLLDILRVCAAALSCSTTLHISYDPKEISFQITSDWKKKMPLFHFIPEDQSRFIHRLEQGMFHRVRLLSPATPLLQKAAAKKACFIDDAPILASGRFELLRYLREVSISYDYHRYGNLGVREGEHRKPLM
jgi:RHH-type proline utilization regulon transcriptional repressor/proline dehydrogenase/delta 1-pyrroline-5-carboxylate dehydrogenase